MRPHPFSNMMEATAEFMQTLNIQVQTIEANSIHDAIWGLTNCSAVEICMEGHTACIVALGPATLKNLSSSGRDRRREQRYG
jgi:hypothetical protein